MELRRARYHAGGEELDNLDEHTALEIKTMTVRMKSPGGGNGGTHSEQRRLGVSTA